MRTFKCADDNYVRVLRMQCSRSLIANTIECGLLIHRPPPTLIHRLLLARSCLRFASWQQFLTQAVRPVRLGSVQFSSLLLHTLKLHWILSTLRMKLKLKLKLNCSSSGNTRMCIVTKGRTSPGAAYEMPANVTAPWIFSLSPA